MEFERPALAPEHPEDCVECEEGTTFLHFYVPPPPTDDARPSQPRE